MPSMIKDDVASYLTNMATDCKPRRMSNLDTALYEAFLWQEAISFAEKKYKAAMTALTDAVSTTDDQMRALDEGEHTVSTGNRFCVIAKIGAPKKCFDKEVFITNVAHKWRIPVAKLETMAEVSKKDTKASLSKRIVEL